MAQFEISTDFRKFNKQTLGIEDVVPLPVILSRSPDTTEGTLLLQKTARYWNSLEEFRIRRRRARNYLRGNQWSDIVEVNGKRITEEEFIKSQGRVPLKNNQIQQIRKNIMGQWRSNSTKPIVQSVSRKDARAEEMVTNALYKAYDINNIIELDARAFDEFLLSGSAVCRTSYEWFKERGMNDVFVKNPNINRMFMNTDIEDPRMIDINFIGQFMDLDLDQVIAAFAKTDDDKTWIESIYTNRSMDSDPGSRAFTAWRTDNVSFLTTNDPSKCRLFEVWQLKMLPVLHCLDQLTGKTVSTRKKKKDIDLVNRQRIEQAQAQGVPAEMVPIVQYQSAFEQIWEVQFLTPYGQVLYTSETPYTHESHPFTVVLYPLIDSEVWGVYEDIIDQQRYINRMIILFDFIIAASAKGVLIVDENTITDDMDLDAIAEEWVKYNGVIKIKMKPGAEVPRQISANATNIGLQEMIALQMRLLQDISGVSGAVQGQTPTSGTSGTLYHQQVQNSVTNLKDYFTTFQSVYKQPRDMKMLKVICQYYQDNRNISGSTTNDNFEGTDFWDPDVIRDLEFDLAIVEDGDTPVYRDMMEQNLKDLFTQQAITLQTYLENSSMPFADKILDAVKNQQQAVQQGQQPQTSPEMAQQAAQANPQTMGMMNKMLSGNRPHVANAA